MKKLLIVILAFLSFQVINAQQEGFRNYAWGTSLKTIEAKETSLPVRNVGQQVLIYEDNLGGDSCQVYFILKENDQLTGGMYQFTKLYRNPQLYVDQYDKFLEVLVDKYGEPAGEKQTWHQGYRGLDRTSFGKEVAEGRLSLNTEWNTANGNVAISLTRGSDMKPRLQIFYHQGAAPVTIDRGKKTAYAKL